MMLKKTIKTILLNNSKGMSLIEVIVVIALIGILAIPIMQITITNNNIFVATDKQMTNKSIAIAVKEYIKQEIRTAKAVRIVSVEEGIAPILQEGEKAIYIKNKNLIYESSEGKQQVILVHHHELCLTGISLS